MKISGLLILVTILAFAPKMAGADNSCRVIEYPDHFEASCQGVSGPEPPQAPSPIAPREAAGQTATAANSVERLPKPEMQALQTPGSDHLGKETAHRQRRRSEAAIDVARSLRTEQIMGSKH